MRIELENVYSRLYNDYDSMLRNISNSSEILNIVKGEISDFENQFQYNQVKVRPDTKLFLLVIFHQMVDMPIREENFGFNRDFVATYIKEDVSRLLKLAFDEEFNQNSNEITAHTILTLIDREWDVLNISLKALWNK